MIRRVLCISAERFIDDYLPLNEERYKYNYISVRSHKELRLKPDSDRFLTLKFDDIDPDKYDVEYIPPGWILFNKQLAGEAVDFLNMIESREDSESLIIHCDAGVHRSCAIGLYAVHLYGLNEREFLKDNPHANFNEFVLRLLQEVQKV